MIDIERLHGCIGKINSRSCLGRREGATTALLYLMLGEVLVGQVESGQTYIVVCNNINAAEMTAQEFRTLLTCEGIQLEIYRKTVVKPVGCPRFMFIGVQNLIDGYTLRGMRIARVFVDVSPELYARDYDYYKIRDALYYAGIAKEDIVSTSF